jgi:broad specificity phosphatase PhoE
VTVARLLLARHGQTAYNRDRRFTGWHDPPLTRRGRAEARALGRLLARQPIDAAYVSDLGRAVETATLALAGRNLSAPTADPALREASFGEWEGLTFDAARRRDPQPFESLLQRRIDFRAPAGESIPDVHARVTACLERLHLRNRDQTVLIVASGGPLQILVCDLFAMPISNHWRLAISNCSLTIVNFVDREPTLSLLNGRAHLSRFRDRTAKPERSAEAVPNRRMAP